MKSPQTKQNGIGDTEGKGINRNDRSNKTIGRFTTKPTYMYKAKVSAVKDTIPQIVESF